MTGHLTVVCSGRDRHGQPTHDRTVVANLGVEDTVGIVLMPTAQQRGNPQAGRPRALGADLDCLVCGDRVRVGKPPHRRLRWQIAQCQAAGVHEIPLHLLHP
jgi:hypothetical protein